MLAVPICTRRAYSPVSIRVNRTTGLKYVATTGNDTPIHQPSGKPGFFEDFFDDKPQAVRTFWRVVNQRLAAANHVA